VDDVISVDVPVAPTAGLTISVRTRRDVVIIDPEKFLAAARQALRDRNPDLTDSRAAEMLTDVTEAVCALLDRDGQLALDEHGVVLNEPEFGPGARPPRARDLDRTDGLSPAGWLQQIVFDDPRPLQDYGCFLPADPFALPTPRRGSPL
jgi:hypothetical protein